MANESLVSITNLSFSYGGEWVLEDVNLELQANDFISIVGPNGGGKTTLLKLMLGLLQPDRGRGRGRIRVLGREPGEMCAELGYVPQQSDIDPLFPMSVLDVVLMGRLGRTRWMGPFGRKDRQIARDALERMGLGDLRRQSFSRLSGGQKQRVYIARALASEPKLLLLDEPTSNLDAPSERELYQHLDRLSREMTVVIVSHDLGFVTQYVRTVLCVNRTVLVHPTQELTGEIIQKVYGSEMRMVRHDHSDGGHGHYE